MSEDVELEIVLKAKGIDVATSRDAGIWLTTMGLITGAKPPGPKSETAKHDTPGTTGDDLISKFAGELGVQREQLEGAGGLSTESPYVHLDHKYWAALKASPGTKSVAPVVLAASLLLLWDRHAKIGDVNLTACGNVLKTIDLTTKNAARGFKNCPWIQIRGSSIKLNPALIGQAEELVRKYCTNMTGGR